jgi:galactose mutarotase-like enzyme
MTISISNTFLKATFNTKGAELTALHSKQRNYIWNGNPQFWGKHSPILFPIVGTIKNNEYFFEGKKYNLNRHGFARDLDFKIISQTQTSVVFSLKNNYKTILAFPFEFELQILYQLDENKLNVSYRVQNNDKKIMPFSIGAHPAFALNESFENYGLQFSDDEKINYYLLDSDLVAEKSTILKVKNKRLDLNYKLFENDALVFKSMQSDAITIFEYDKAILKLHYKGFPNFGIWTKHNAPFICLEPWYGYSDTNESTQQIVEKEGIQLLKPNAIFDATYNIEIL